MYCGIDSGASATKVVIIDEKKNICGYGVTKSGIEFAESAQRCLKSALEAFGGKEENLKMIFCTGYGRYNVEKCTGRRTEISCHARAASHFKPGKITVVDIGGQDSKVIYLDEEGKRADFKMNRKCAAGTGAFLEEISAQLGIPLDKMAELAEKATQNLTLGSFCTVFTKTEILTLARQGKKLEDILRAVYDSVAKRIIEMAPLEGNVVITGGVIAHNPIVGHLIEEKTGATIFVPPLPQFAGAFGAALFALEYDIGKNIDNDKSDKTEI